jgi:LacI family transcriptional regulator
VAVDAFGEALPEDWDRATAAVLARDDPGLIDAWLGRGVPVVVAAGDPYPGAIQVGVEAATAGRLAAEYYLAHGHRHFACYGDATRLAAAARVDGFCRRVQAAGQTVTILADDDLVMNDAPRPLALFCVDVLAARRALAVCRDHGLAVPDQVAILSGDYDQLIAEVSGLGGVRLGAERIGYLAGDLLQRQLAGERIACGVQAIEPRAVEPGPSAAGFAVVDELLANALALIQAQVGEGLTVSGLADGLAVSRRTLENHFRRHLGTTPGQRIREARLERARYLLVHSRAPLATVAARAGFGSAGRFAADFRAAVGYPPGRYRQLFG